MQFEEPEPAVFAKWAVSLRSATNIPGYQASAQLELLERIDFQQENL